MPRSRHLLAALIVILPGVAKGAVCVSQGSTDAQVEALSMQTEAGATALVSASFAIQLQKLTYREVLKRPAECDRGTFKVKRTTYSLAGEDSRRVARPLRHGAPLATLVPVAGIDAIVDASKTGQVAAVDGYLLTTLTPSEAIGWRVYSGVPVDAVLRSDMERALGGKLSPLFRTDLLTGQTSLFAR